MLKALKPQKLWLVSLLALVMFSGCEVVREKWAEIQPNLQRNPERANNAKQSSGSEQTNAGTSVAASEDMQGRLMALNPTTKRLFDQQYELQFTVANASNSHLEFDKVTFHMWLGGREFIHGVEPLRIALPPQQRQVIKFPAYANMLEWTEDAKMVRQKGRDEYAYLLNVKLDSDKLLAVDKNITMKGSLDLVATDKGLRADNIR